MLSELSLVLLVNDDILEEENKKEEKEGGGARGERRMRESDDGEKFSSPVLALFTESLLPRLVFCLFVCLFLGFFCTTSYYIFLINMNMSHKLNLASLTFQALVLETCLGHDYTHSKSNLME